MTFSLQTIHVKLAAVALAATLSTASPATAKNHDCQSFKLPSSVFTSHDRAPGPTSRTPN